MLGVTHLQNATYCTQAMFLVRSRGSKDLQDDVGSQSPCLD